MQMNHTIRLETPADYDEVNRLVYAAFKDLVLPGRERCDEHFLVHTLRSHEIFIPKLSFVAEAQEPQDKGQIIGQIVYAKATVLDETGGEHEVISFGPLSVLPQHQGQGIGAALVRHSLAQATRLGYKGVLIFGHEKYYPRFGFQNAKAFGITTREGQNFDAFMALPLAPGALDGVRGRFLLDPVYEVDPLALERFNQTFFG